MSMQTYYNIKKMLCRELDNYGDRGQIKDMEELRTIDMITHAIKSVSTIIAMDEAAYEGASGHYPPFMFGGRSFDESGFSSRESRESGRSNAQRRNAMGQFSRDGSYDERSMRRSRDSGMADELRELMYRAKDDETRMKFKRFIMDLEED
ncbi:MAG: hypothetical protein J6U54_07890 [Clostridiales bacterium]|nr:hypothetical protein [Clostridiales bacterium]